MTSSNGAGMMPNIALRTAAAGPDVDSKAVANEMGTAGFVRAPTKVMRPDIRS